MSFGRKLSVRSDPQNFSEQGIELLRKGVRGAGRFSLRAVAHADVEIAVIAAAGLGERIEDRIAHGVIAVESDAQKFARGAFERGVANVRVRPFHQDGFEMDGARRRIHRVGRRVPVEIQTGKHGVDRHGDPGQIRILRVHGIEFSVFRVGRIKGDGNNAGGVAAVGCEFRENIREFDIGREFLGGRVQDVERAALSLTKMREAASGAFAGSARNGLTRPSCPLKSICAIFAPPCVALESGGFA